MPSAILTDPTNSNPQVVTGQLQVAGSGTSDFPELVVKGIASQVSKLVSVQTSAGVEKMSVDNSGNVAVAGTLAVTGATTFTGLVTMNGNVVVSAATALTPTAAQSGTMFLLTGAAPAVTLPAAVLGLSYTFVFQQTAGNTQMTIATGTASIIRAKTTGAGTTTINTTATTGSLRNTTATSLRGDLVTLVSDGTDWYATATQGTWSVT